MNAGAATFVDENPAAAVGLLRFEVKALKQGVEVDDPVLNISSVLIEGSELNLNFASQNNSAAQKNWTVQGLQASLKLFTGQSLRLFYDEDFKRGSNLF